MIPTKFQFIWESGFGGKDFLEIEPIRNKNCLWRPCLITDKNEMSNLYRSLPQIFPTMFLIIWRSGYRGEDFQKSTNQKQELPVVAIFVNGSGRNEHLYRGPSIDASYQISVHLGKTDLEENIIQKSTNQKQELPVAAMIVNESRRNEQS